MASATGVPSDRVQPHETVPKKAAYTRETLAEHLAALGVAAGTTVLVHASMKAVGAVRGPTGAADPVAAAVLGALRDVLGRRGTVVVPSFTEGNSKTSRVHRGRTAGMGAAELAAFHSSMAPFDRDATPADGGGRFAEAVRRSPGARRSAHPQTSFVALGARAEEAVGRHDEKCHLGEDSPLSWLYRNDARVVMIGVGYDVCSAFHLAEYRIPHPPRRDYECVVRRPGGTRWITYNDVDLDDSDFAKLGMAYEKADTDRASRLVLPGRLGAAEARCLVLADAVDFAVRWLAENRRGKGEPGV